jgi:aminoglycoside phosphotransferase (APT) family kinase protein
VRHSAPGLVAAYDAAIPQLLALPRTVIHGEFHASNVMAEPAPPAVRIRPVDWEVAALAPGPMDLADLTAGKWSGVQRDAMVSAYRAALPDATAADFARDLDCCRLHRALQWASWSDDWTPPREHEQDWLAEAGRVAARLGVA